MTAPYSIVIAAEAKRHHVPAEILTAIMMRESHGNWWTVGALGEVSLMQLRMSTAVALCPRYVSTLWQPRSNIACAAKILRSHWRRCGTWVQSASAYNGSRVACGVTAYGIAIMEGGR